MFRKDLVGMYVVSMVCTYDDGSIYEFEQFHDFDLEVIEKYLWGAGVNITCDKGICFNDNNRIVGCKYVVRIIINELKSKIKNEIEMKIVRLNKESK